MTWRGLVLPGLGLVLAAAPPGVTPPLVHHFRLPNGLAVSLVERHDRPLVRAELRVTWAAGAEVGPATLTALQRILGIREGGPYDVEGFTRGVEDAGARLTFSAEYRAFSWQMLAPSAEQDIALDLLAHRALHPPLTPQHLEQLRRELRKGLGEAPLANRAKDRFLGLLGAPSPLLGAAEDALDRLNLETLIAAHRNLVQPAQARLIFHGDLSVDQARQSALLHFGAWGKPVLPSPVLPPPPPQARWVVVPEPGRPLEVWLAFRFEGRDDPSLALLGAGLKRHWRRPPSPFLEVECLKEGEDGLLIFRLRSNAKTAPLEALQSLRKTLGQLREEGLPGQLWTEVLEESRHQRAAEYLHPEAWVARLAREGQAALPGVEGLNTQLREILAESNLTGLILGADAQSRTALAAGGLGALLWLDR